MAGELGTCLRLGMHGKLGALGREFPVLKPMALTGPPDERTLCELLHVPFLQAKEITKDGANVRQLISSAKNKVASCHKLSGEAALINLFQIETGTSTLENYLIKRAEAYGKYYDR